MDDEKALRIVSDGTGLGTHIYIDDKEVRHVQALELLIDSPDGYASIMLTISGSNIPALELQTGRYRLTKINEVTNE